MSTKLAKDEQQQALAIPAEINFEADADDGFQNVDSESRAIPFLTMLQAMSQDLLDKIDGSKAGMIVDTVTLEAFTEVDVIPCGFQRNYKRWVPRDDGGGYKGQYSVAEVRRMEQAGEIQPKEDNPNIFDIEGDELKDTRDHFVLYNKDGQWRPALISMSSTQIKRSKNWIALQQNHRMKRSDGTEFTPASYALVYTLGAQKEEKNGNRWFTFDARFKQVNADRAAYELARKFADDIKKGTVEVSQPVADEQQGF
jgi:hypothetical protein